MNKLKTVFMGTPDFSVPCLEILFNHPMIELHSIVTMPDRKAGRGKQLLSPPVADFANKNKVKLIQTENINHESEYLSELKNHHIDLIIVIAFAQFLNDDVLSIPQKGCFNIHTSLLPKYRGAAPIQYALLNDDKVTGVSIQKMVKKMDAGDIALTSEISISSEETSGLLFSRLKLQAGLTLNQFVFNLVAGDISYQQQDEAKVSYAPTLQREDGYIKFSDLTFDEIRNKHRAYTPWPGIFCILNKKRLKIFEIEKTNKNLEAGSISNDQGKILVGCKDNAIRLKTIQLEGKKKCTDQELLNGFKEDLILGE